MQCETCQGNGEVVTDWNRYLKPQPGDVGDEAVAECPACCGQGEIGEPHPSWAAAEARWLDKPRRRI